MSGRPVKWKLFSGQHWAERRNWVKCLLLNIHKDKVVSGILRRWIELYTTCVVIWATRTLVVELPIHDCDK